MNFQTLKQQLTGLDYASQNAYLLKLGYKVSEIPPLLDWLFSQAVRSDSGQADRAKKPDRMTETLEKCALQIEQARLNPQPVKQDGLTQFERDVLHNQYLRDGSTLFDPASYHDPDSRIERGYPRLRQTESLNWLRNEFHATGKCFALLLGGTGAGKTFAALAYINLIAKVDVSMGKIQHSNAAYIHAYKLAELLHESKKHSAELDTLTRKSILLLDDLGAEPVGFKGKDFKSNLEYLIDERSNHRRKTFFTTNATLEDFKAEYGERIASRFSGVGAYFQTSDPDLRRT